MANVLNFVSNPIIPTSGTIEMAKILDGTVTDLVSVGPKLHLYSNDIPLTIGTVVGDLVEVIATGYAAVTLSTMHNILGIDGQPVLTDAVASFVGGNPLTVPDQAVGVYMTNFAGTVLISVQRFDDIFPFDDVGDTVNVTPILRLPGLEPT